MDTLADRNTEAPRAGLPFAAFLIVGLAALLAALLTSRSTTVVGSIDGEPITAAGFDRHVRLQQLRYALRSSTAEVDQAALLNRMIGDALLLHAARDAGVEPSSARIQSEIDGILGRLGLTREEMAQLLGEHELTWDDLELSVREYVTMNEFTNAVLLADVAPAERENRLEAWMQEQYDAAEMDFDQTFLDGISAAGGASG